MSLKGIAQETIRIQETGEYELPSGEVVRFKREQQAAEEGTHLYTPQALAAQSSAAESSATDKLTISVTPESTQMAARRLVERCQFDDLVVLNFASARNVGGGFLRGAKAQEEDVARSSGVFRCFQSQPEFYRANREQRSLLYTDHLIYSPDVPWFRETNRELLERFYLASIITAPAPNAGEHLRKFPQDSAGVMASLRRRARYVLEIARHRNHRHLLLGAWGCGVFRNSADDVAAVFGDLLAGDFARDFAHVTFAVYDRSKEARTLAAFRARFELSR